MQKPEPGQKMFPVRQVRLWLIVVVIAGLNLFSSISHGQRLSDKMWGEMMEAAALMENNQDSAMEVSRGIWEEIETTNDLWLMGIGRGFLAYQWSKVGDTEISYMNFRSALDLLERADTLDCYNLSLVLVGLGIVHSDYEDSGRAIEYFERAVEYVDLYLTEHPDGERRSEFEIYRESYLFSVAIERSKKGDLETAERTLLTLLDGYQMGDNFLTRGSILNELALLQLKLENFEASKEYFNQIIDDEEIEEEDKGIALHNLAGVFSQLGELDKAEELFLAALNNTSRRHNKRSVFLTHVELGEVYFKSGDMEAGIKTWRRALDSFPDLVEPEQYDVYDWLAKGYKALGEYELAKSYEALYVKYKEGYEKSLAVIRANEDRDSFLSLVERLRNEELEKKLQGEYRVIIILAVGMAVLLTSLVLIRRKKMRQKKLYQQLGDILTDD